MRVIYDHELVLFSEGRFVVEIEGRQYDCSKGNYLIVPPGVWHTTWEAAGLFGHRHWSHFDWVHQDPYNDSPLLTYSPLKPIEALYRHAPDFVPQSIFHGVISRFGRVMETSERLYALLNRGGEHARRVGRAVLHELLLELLDGPEPEVITAVSNHDELAATVRLLLEANVDKHATVRIEDLLEKTHFSYAHVCRIFRKRYGMAPLKYLHLLCVSRAKLMLRDTDLPVATIARRLAFLDPEYFAQVFRRHVGQSPSAYRMAATTGRAI